MTQLDPARSFWSALVQLAALWSTLELSRITHSRKFFDCEAKKNKTMAHCGQVNLFSISIAKYPLYIVQLIQGLKNLGTEQQLATLHAGINCQKMFCKKCELVFWQEWILIFSPLCVPRSGINGGKHLLSKFILRQSKDIFAVVISKRAAELQFHVLL